MTKIKNNFVFGAIILLFCNLISKLIGAIYRIPLLKVLGSEGLGLYQMIFPIYALVLVIYSTGIVVSLSKFVSKETTYHNSYNIKKYMQASFVLTTFISLILTFLLLIISPKLSIYQGNSNLLYFYFAIILAIILSSLFCVFRGYFLGKNEMLISGSVHIVEQVCQLFFSLFLATKFASIGVSMAVCGAVLGITISEVISLLFVFIIYFYSKKKIGSAIGRKIAKKGYESSIFCIDKIFIAKKRYITIKQAFLKVLSFSFFVSLEACIIPLISAIDSLVIVPLLLKCGLNSAVAYSIFGIEDGIVTSLVSLPTVVATSIGASIIPNLKNSISGNETKINVGLKYVWLVGIASATVFIFFASDITSLLYANGFDGKVFNELKISSDLLKINSFNIIYLSLLNLTTSILQGLDKSKIPVINLGFCAILRLVLLLSLLPNSSINIYGTALADMVFYSLSLILNIISIKKVVKIEMPLQKIFIYPLVYCIVMWLSMDLFKLVFNDILNSRITTLLMVFTGGVVYLILLFATKSLDYKEM